VTFGEPFALSTWGTSKWGQAAWVGGPAGPPGAGWGDDWRFWYQLGGVVVAELTDLVVEARWTTDSRTFGDGTFRGDIQPGKCTIRLWDPGGTLDTVDKLGAVWAQYQPTGATWCWFYGSVTRGLYAPNDPQAADVVYSGLPWAPRMTSDVYTETGRAAESTTARISALVDQLTTTLLAWKMPVINKDIDTQSQLVAARVRQTTTPFNFYPNYLQAFRDAATDGVFSLDAQCPAPGGPGNLIARYKRWETHNDRNLNTGQVIAGPAVDTDVTALTTYLLWTATRGDTGAQSTFNDGQGGSGAYGYSGPSLRLYGDVSAGGAELGAVQSTSDGALSVRSDPTVKHTSSVMVQSGDRFTSQGKPSTNDWDPRAHVWAPTDMCMFHPTTDGATTQFTWVTHSDHILNAQMWQTVHTLEPWTIGAALP
jgi:hypothetical protein